MALKIAKGDSIKVTVPALTISRAKRGSLNENNN